VILRIRRSPKARHVLCPHRRWLSPRDDVPSPSSSSREEEHREETVPGGSRKQCSTCAARRPRWCDSHSSPSGTSNPWSPTKPRIHPSRPPLHDPWRRNSSPREAAPVGEPPSWCWYRQGRSNAFQTPTWCGSCTSSLDTPIPAEGPSDATPCERSGRPLHPRLVEETTSSSWNVPTGHLSPSPQANVLKTTKSPIPIPIFPSACLQGSTVQASRRA